MTYDEAIATLNQINADIRANVCPKVKTEADVEPYKAWLARSRELTEAARAHGFIRIFNGEFKLDLSKFDAAATEPACWNGQTARQRVGGTFGS